MQALISRRDPRYQLTLGSRPERCFTIHGKREQPLSEMLISPRILRQYHNSRSSLNSIRADLRMAVITYSTMFRISTDVPWTSVRGSKRAESLSDFLSEYQPQTAQRAPKAVERKSTFLLVSLAALVRVRL